MYTRVDPTFFYIKVGCKGVFVTRTCFRDAILGDIAVLGCTALLHVSGHIKHDQLFTLLQGYPN